MTIDEQIEFFFAPPVPEQVGLERSSLHQNRREIQDVFVRNAYAEDDVLKRPSEERHALFATVMVIGAGIDLLAKFYRGSDKNGEVGERIIDFLQRYMFNGKPDGKVLARIVYEGLRSPMMHSFTLRSKKHSVKLVSHMPELQGKAVWKYKSKPTAYLVSVEGLFSDYIRALNAYRTDLLTNMNLRTKFALMMPQYGYIRMSDVFPDVNDLE
jgi:hypothetical protein